MDDLANELKDGNFDSIRVAVVEGADAQSAAGLTKSPSLQVHRKFVGVVAGEEEPVVTYDFSARPNLGAFIKNSAFPLVGEISPSNFAQYEKRGLPFVWVFLPGPPLVSDEESKSESSAEIAQANQKVREELRQVAKKHPELSFVHLSGEEYREHASSLGVDVDKLPAAVIMKLEGRDKFVFNSSLSFKQSEISKVTHFMLALLGRESWH